MIHVSWCGRSTSKGITEFLVKVYKNVASMVLKLLRPEIRLKIWLQKRVVGFNCPDAKVCVRRDLTPVYLFSLSISLSPYFICR